MTTGDRHLTRPEQRAMDAALRRSVRVLGGPTEDAGAASAPEAPEHCGDAATALDGLAARGWHPITDAPLDRSVLVALFAYGAPKYVVMARWGRGWNGSQARDGWALHGLPLTRPGGPEAFVAAGLVGSPGLAPTHFREVP